MGMPFDINYRNFNHAYSFAYLENNLYLVRQSFILAKIVGCQVRNYFKIKVIINFESYKIKKQEILAKPCLLIKITFAWTTLIELTFLI